MLDDRVVTWLVASVPAWPALAFLVLGAIMLVHRAPGERVVRALVVGSLTLSLASSIAVAFELLGTGAYTISLGSWFAAGSHEFELAFYLDSLSVVMMILVSAITTLIGRFSVHYIHRQPGFARFFLLLALFAVGMLLVVMAASADFLFIGWELVALSSALLIAFFHTRRMPVRAGLRAFITYRVCDIGLLVGLVLLHEAAGTSHFAYALGALSAAHASGVVVTLLGLCFLLAAMGKSAQFPFGSWLPRAMEGPTPSSALFYGALSVHAGVYLLLRIEPLFASSTVASVALVWIGVVTAVHAGLVSRVQTDAKSGLAYATMTQVGIMFAEIGLGLTTLCTVHLVAHASLRAFQLLRAPSALLAAERLRAAGVLVRGESLLVRMLPRRARLWLYRTALERFHLETLHERLVVTPVLALGKMIDRIERLWLERVSDIGTGE